MLNRLLSILLIPLFVLGQALPHSHAGSGMVEPEDHANLPHLHLSSGHSHGHHHGDGHRHGHDDGHGDHGHAHPSDTPTGQSPQAGQSPKAGESPQATFMSTPVDHDSDAVYVAQSNNTLGRASHVLQASFASVGVFVEFPADRHDRQWLHRSNQMPDRSTGLPIYLLVASLRL
ncbi:hypothetical protein [Neorhodopirellula pilleata]|uniref:hypothetical protein n=1 Tax=Neorhodopirellula pilleata TaxID=2714738 RepID=UPI001E4F129C|nr:hypothetical protein [Neorhodopirellula pilleata]